MKKISVVVPIYNEEKHLNRCIESILAQSFNDWELILVDDGSEDGSIEICEDYARKDSRIKVIHQQNKGYSGARNTGILVAEGKYIIFVDGDDWIEPSTLMAGYNGMEQNGVDIVIGGVNVRIFDGDTQVDITEGSLEEDYIFNMKDFNVAAPRLRDISGTLLYCVWSRLYKMDIIRDNGLRFDENLFVQEDVKFIYRYYYHCDKCMASHETFYNYCRPVGKDDIAEKPQIDQFRCVEESLISFLRMEFKFKFPKDFCIDMYEMTYDHFIKLSNKIFMPDTGLSIEEQKRYMSSIIDSFAFRFFCEKLSPRDSFWEKMKILLENNDLEAIFVEWLDKISEGLALPCT